MPTPSRLARAVRRRAGRLARRIGVSRDGRRLVVHRPPSSVVRSALVEEFRPYRVTGWVSVTPGSPAVTVRLLLNGREVVRTRAADLVDRDDPGGEVRRFRFILRDLPQYIGPGDSLVVEVDGSPAPIFGAGMRFRPEEQGEFTSADLWHQFDRGFILSRNGEFQQSKRDDLQWQAEVTGMAERVGDLLRREFDLDVFYTYGSMLGAVREGGFIGHDDDLDLAYVSRHRVGADVAAETRDVALALLSDGWFVEAKPTHLHAMAEIDGRIERVDVFTHYFDEAGLLQTPWGQAGTTHVHVDDWAGVREVPFAAGTAPVPVVAEQVLAQFYGAGWREPQPSFNWYRDRVERGTAGMLPVDVCDELYWIDWHRRFAFDAPSVFHDVLSERLDCPATVVDLGAGDGRDTVGFAGAGRRVFAVDRSLAGRERIAQKCAEAEVDALVTVHDADVLSDALADVLAEATATAGDAPVLFYLRFLLHRFTPEEELPLLASLRAAARPGDMFAAEFRSTKDKNLVKRHERVAARFFRDGAELAERLRYDYGLTVLQADRRLGRSPYGIEDADLFRIIGRYGAVTSGP